MDEPALLRLGRRLANMVARAVVRLASDAPTMQTVQFEVLDGEVRDGAERFQQYGFTSVPFPGAEAIVLFPLGHSDHALITNVDDRRYRLKNLAPGEVALYTDEGDKIVLNRGRIIEVTAGTRVTVTAPLVEFTGNVTIGGTLVVTGAITGADVTAGAIGLETHKHGGVTTGGGVSGVSVP